MKIFLVILVIVILASSVIADVEKPRKWYRRPFRKIWNALLDLQEQIDNIQLIPGPEGEQGPEGPSGIDGEKGDTGPEGEKGDAGECECSINLEEFEALVERVETLEANLVDDVSDPDYTVAEGDVIITEIMYNPNSVSDSNGEWFEIYNKQSFDISLKGWSISDYGSDYFVIDEDLMILSEEHLVFCKNNDVETNGGIECDLEYNSFTLGNSDDEIVLMIEDDVIDEVLYNEWSDNAGYSAQLSSDYYDSVENNDGENWCNGDYGTPGEMNELC